MTVPQESYYIMNDNTITTHLSSLTVGTAQYKY